MAFQNLTLVPLISDCDREAGYVLLDDALARGWVTVTELGEGGQVPELKVVNRGDVAVLLLDGEELVGAKQNRVLNLTILLPPRHTTTIPVSCVESGRWRRVSHQFGSANRMQFAEGRAAKMHQVTSSLAAHGTRRSDQQAVWSAIAEKSARLGAESDTAAMAAMYEKLDHSLEDFIAAFPPVDRQVGAVFLVNGRLAGLELFDAPSTWRTLSPKLVRSYALDAIDRKQAQPPLKSQDGRFLIDAVAASQSAVFPAVGEGDDVRLSGRDLIGAALVARERAIHVCAFMTVSEA
jgi:ARG and Rhodanese-Phosphatase-superfamily-associated Protein domain